MAGGFFGSMLDGGDLGGDSWGGSPINDAVMKLITQMINPGNQQQGQQGQQSTTPPGMSRTPPGTYGPDPSKNDWLLQMIHANPMSFL